ncbi:MAG: HD domain-containing phosphohydrolase, partial [Aminivibrio sp.]
SPEPLAASWDGVSISNVNDAFCRIACLGREEVITSPIAGDFCLMPLEDSAGIADLAQKAMEGEPVLSEGAFRNRCGDELYLSVLALPVSDGSEDRRGLYLFFRDLTAIREKERQLTSNMEKLNRAFSQTIEVLAQTVESRDPYTAGHRKRTALLSEAIARKMGLDEASCREIYLAAAIHDIGKICVPAEILSKPGLLQPVEMNLVRTHAQEGYEILSRADFPWNIAEVVKQHHERLDGSGYPDGLKAEEILPEAKILAVADVVEAMASYRPYRASLGIEKALDFIESNRGKLFDPLIVGACREVFDDNFCFGEGDG